MGDFGTMTYFDIGNTSSAVPGNHSSWYIGASCGNSCEIFITFQCEKKIPIPSTVRTSSQQNSKIKSENMTTWLYNCERKYQHEIWELPTAIHKKNTLEL